MFRVLLTLGIGLPVFGGLFAWYGFKERAIARESSQTPETIPLSKLIARGPNGNANVIVTDFVMLRDHAVERGKRNRWSGAWVPIVPTDAGPPGGGSPRAVKALVYCTKGSSPEEVYQRVSTPQLAGLVINKVKTPKSNVEEHFRAAYPGTDFATCIYIQEGREPASETLASLLIFGGIAAVVIGLGLLGLLAFLWLKKSSGGKSSGDEYRAPKSKKRRPRGDDDEDDDRPRKRRPADDDEDERPSRSRRRDEGDEDDIPRRKRRPAEDDDEPPRNRRVARDEDDEDDRPRRRPGRDDDDDEPPRRRPRRDD